VGWRFVPFAVDPFGSRLGRSGTLAHEELAGLDAHKLHAERIRDLFVRWYSAGANGGQCEKDIRKGEASHESS
jgi:hypothetical protein